MMKKDKKDAGPDSDADSKIQHTAAVVDCIKESYGQYEIQEKIGSGGMGMVFRARDTKLHRMVALKFLSLLLSQDEKSCKRFMVEARAISKMDHPNICAIYDIAEANDGRMYIIMPCYEGEDLNTLLNQGGLTMEKAIDFMIQICSGIDAAHKKEVVHRDIKPANMLVTNEGVVKVVDFGLAKMADLELTQSGAALGTMFYMSPEQLSANPVDHRSDIWSLGVVFYELMAGERPFTGNSSFEISRKIMSADYVPLSQKLASASRIMDSIISKTLRVMPSDRYNNATEMIADLKILQQETDPYILQSKIIHVPSAAGDSFLMSESLGKIKNELEKHLGSSARILVNSLSNQCKTIAELKSALAMEISDKSARSEFLENTKSIGASTDRRIWTSRKAAIFGVLFLAVLIVGAIILSSKNYRFAAQDLMDSITTSSVDVRGVSSDKILLGMTAAFSGPNKELGLSMKAGMRARFEEVNDEGGIHGRQIDIKDVDDGYIPEKALENLSGLLDEESGVFALIGNVGTPTAEVIIPVINKNKTLLFGTFSGAQMLRHNPPDKYVFNYRASYADETERLVEYFTKNLGIDPNRIGVFYQADSYGNDGHNGVKSALRELDVRPNPIEATYERNSGDVSDGIKKFLDSKDDLDATIVIGSYKPSALFTKGLRDGGYTGEIANVSFVGSEALASEFQFIGSKYGDGVIVSQVVPSFTSNSSAVSTYREILKKHVSSMSPDFVSLEGYIIASIFCEALERCGRQLTTERMVKSLESIKDLELGIGPRISFSMSNHQGSDYVWGTRLSKDGTFEQIWQPDLPD